MGYAYVNAQMLHREIDTRQKAEAERQAIIEKALTALQQSSAFSDISDPAEWQREIRKDSPLLGRD